jgi:hypothetical protein
MTIWWTANSSPPTYREVDVSRNAIELQDGEFFAAMRTLDRLEQNSTMLLQ